MKDTVVYISIYLEGKPATYLEFFELVKILSLVLDSEGQVRPFVFCLDKWIGNVDEDSIDDIWNNESMQEHRRRILDRDYVNLCQPECISGQVADKIRDIVV